MVMERFDIIVIGGGINSLVTASMLGKAGKKVMVLEARDQIGGLASTSEFAPGYNIVVSARPATAGASYYMLMSSLKRLARQTGLLEPETLKSTELNDKGMLVENASENDVFERDTT